MSWCKNFSKGGWESPCRLEVVLAVVFLVATCLILGFQLRRMSLLLARRAGRTMWPSHVSLALLFIYTLNAVLHLAWLIADSILSQTAGFQIFSEAIFLACWTAVLVRLFLLFITCSSKLWEGHAGGLYPPTL